MSIPNMAVHERQTDGGVTDERLPLPDHLPLGVKSPCLKRPSQTEGNKFFICFKFAFRVLTKRDWARLQLQSESDCRNNGVRCRIMLRQL